MAEYKDRVKDQTNTTGTGTITVDGVAGSGGYRTIAAAHTNGATLRYTIINSTGSEWEVGEGVWTSATSTLTRATVYASSNSGSLVSFSAGAKVVFTGPAAQDMTDAIGPINTLVASGTIYLLGTTQSTATNGATPRVAGGLSYNATNGTLSTPSGTVLDANNYTTYTVTKTGTGASGSWGIDVTGSAATLTVADTRNATTGPATGQGVRFDFKTNNVDGLNDGGSYHGVMTFQQWTDGSGGGTRQLGFTDNNNLWIRGSGSGISTYSAWKLLLDSTNFSSYALPLSGGTLTGNLTFSGTGLRVLGDFSNATVASRTLFQTSTTNGQTLITAIPNGTAVNSQFQAFNSSDTANSSIASLVAASGTVRLVSGNIGTGTLLPIAFVMSATEVARFTTGGSLLINTTTDDGTNKLQVNGGVAITGALTLPATNELRLADTDSSNYVGLKSPGTVSTNVVWTLPAAEGTNGQVLTTNGVGNLYWSTPSSGSSLTGLTLSSGSFLTALGTGAGTGYNSAATGSIAIGYNAGQNFNSARNIAIGSNTGNGVNTSPDHILIGDSIATNLTSSLYWMNPNIMLGNLIGQTNSTSGYDTSILVGHQANASVGSSNAVVIGHFASRWVNPTQSVVIGNSAHGGGSGATYSASWNVAIGHTALYSIRNGNYNVAIGRQTGYNMTTGARNTLVGAMVATSLGTGSNNTVVGYGATPSSANVSNEITLGDSNVTRFRVPGLGIDWASPAAVPRAGAAFRARRATDQTVTASVWSKVQCTSEDFDVDGTYDNATNFRFSPGFAGYYLITVNTASNYQTIASIYKNGSEYQTVGWGSGGAFTCVTGLVYLAPTDYVEAYVWTDGTTLYANNTAFSGHLVRSA